VSPPRPNSLTVAFEAHKRRMIIVSCEGWHIIGIIGWHRLFVIRHKKWWNYRTSYCDSMLQVQLCFDNGVRAKVSSVEFSPIRSSTWGFWRLKLHAVTLLQLHRPLKTTTSIPVYFIIRFTVVFTHLEPLCYRRRCHNTHAGQVLQLQDTAWVPWNFNERNNRR